MLLSGAAALDDAAGADRRDCEVGDGEILRALLALPGKGTVLDSEMPWMTLVELVDALLAGRAGEWLPRAGECRAVAMDWKGEETDDEALPKPMRSMPELVVVVAAVSLAAAAAAASFSFCACTCCCNAYASASSL